MDADLRTSSRSAATWSSTTWKRCQEASCPADWRRPAPAARRSVFEAIGAPGVRDDEDALHVEEVHAEHERLEGGVGDPATGVAEDLGVARLQADQPERVDPRVHAGDDRDPGVRDTVEPGEGEVVGELAVRREQVVEPGGEGRSAVSFTARTVANRLRSAAWRSGGLLGGASCSVPPAAWPPPWAPGTWWRRTCCPAAAARTPHSGSMATAPRCRRRDPGRGSTVPSASRHRGGERTGWSISYPRGSAPGARLPVYLVLHGASYDHTSAFVDLGLDRFLTLAVTAGTPPFAIATVDGGRTYWRPFEDGSDTSRMLTEGVLPLLRHRSLDVDRVGGGRLVDGRVRRPYGSPVRGHPR